MLLIVKAPLLKAAEITKARGFNVLSVTTTDRTLSTMVIIEKPENRDRLMDWFVEAGPFDPEYGYPEGSLLFYNNLSNLSDAPV